MAPLKPEASGHENLDRLLVKGMLWTGGIKWVSQAVAWVTTIMTARLLKPEDYGIVGMAGVFIGLLGLMNEFGIGITVVSLRDLSDRFLAQLNSFSVIISLIGIGLSAALALPIGAFYVSPEVPGVIMAMAAGFLLTGFKTVPYAVLQKELRFKMLAGIEGVQILVQAILTIAGAAMGWGYWSLVMGILGGSIISTGLTLNVKRLGFQYPQWLEMKGAMTFSGHIVAMRFSWYIQSNADSLIIGRMLGQAALGTYSMAFSLAMVPVEKVAAVASQVTTALFSTVQDDPKALRRYLLALTEGFALLTFPSTLGMALVADTFVPVVLGNQWMDAIAPLQVLAFYAAFRSVQSLTPQVLFVTGGSRLGMRMAVALVFILPMAFCLSARWGAAGVAAAWLIVHPVAAIPTNWHVFRKIELSVLAYFLAFRPALLGSLVMLVAVLGAKGVIPLSWPLPIHLACQIAIGAAAYSAVTLVLYRDRLKGFLLMIRSSAT